MLLWHLVKTIIQTYYNYYIYDIGDPRVKDWFLIYSPWPNIVFITVYIFLVRYFLPNFMENKAAYKFQGTMLCYNSFQIIACTLLVYKIATPFSDPLYSVTCEHVEFSRNPKSLEILQCCYYYYLLKLAEFVETILFGLRKKFNQISTLHVHHHVTTLLMAWLLTKYFGGRMVLFPFMLNSLIHILMYTYYLISSLGGDLQRKAAKWKSTLTFLQMVQFVIVIIQFLQVFLPGCSAPRPLFLALILNVMMIFYNFYRFYRRTYTRSIKSN